MCRRMRWQWIALMTALPLLVGAQESASEHASDSLFGLDRVLEMTLTIEPEDGPNCNHRKGSAWMSERPLES